RRSADRLRKEASNGSGYPVSRSRLLLLFGVPHVVCCHLLNGQSSRYWEYITAGKPGSLACTVPGVFLVWHAAAILMSIFFLVCFRMARLHSLRFMLILIRKQPPDESSSQHWFLRACVIL